MSYLLAFIEFFRFFKHQHERAESRFRREADERAAERQHQREMLETIFNKMIETSKANNEGILALASAQSAQADVMASWLKGFHIADPSPAPPQVVRPEEEWMREQLRLAEMGIPDVALQLPPEFQLAFELSKLNQDALGDFDREGSDFEP